MPIPTPSVTSPVADRHGAFTKPWRDFLLKLAAESDSASIAAELTALAERVTHLEEGADLDALILGQGSVRVYGTLESGTVRIQLENDTPAPGVTYYYGTDSAGSKGFFTVASAFAAGDGVTLTTDEETGVTTIDASGTAGVLPVVTGEVPPVLLHADDGSLIYAPASY